MKLVSEPQEHPYQLRLEVSEEPGMDEPTVRVKLHHLDPHGHNRVASFILDQKDFEDFTATLIEARHRWLS